VTGQPRPSRERMKPVSTSPHFKLASPLKFVTLLPYLGSQGEAITMLKGYLDRDKPILMLTNAEGGVGHYSLIVGYNQESKNPQEHHWIILDSFGRSPSRPDGTHRKLMDTDYSETVKSPYGGHDANVYEFEVLDDSFALDQDPSQPKTTMRPQNEFRR